MKDFMHAITMVLEGKTVEVQQLDEGLEIGKVHHYEYSNGGKRHEYFIPTKIQKNKGYSGIAFDDGAAGRSRKKPKMSSINYTHNWKETPENEIPSHIAAYLKEELTPKQAAIDGNKNGKMDAEDFKILRAKASPTKVCSMCGKSAKDCSCNMKEEAEIDEESEELNEALRKISEHGKGMGDYHAEVRYDPEYQEYQSHFYKNGKHMGEGPVGYHGSGKEGKKDAQDTAEHQVKKMNSRAMSEGAYTQHYMDANNASPVRQAAEIAKAPKQKISFRKDPINAATNAMHDKALDVFQNFGKKKVSEEVSELKEAKSKNYQIRHSSYADAIKHALEYHKSASGLSVSDDDYFNQVSIGQKKPSVDQTVSHRLPATNQKGEQHIIDMQIYNHGGAKTPFELNTFSNKVPKKSGRSMKEVSETTFKYNDFEIELDENFSYADYLNAVKTIVNSDDPSIQSEIISIAAEAYDTQDMNVIIEATTMAHAKSVVESLRKADINTTISNPEAVVLEGKPGFKYSKTNNGKTSVTIHTASGVVRKV